MAIHTVDFADKGQRTIGCECSFEIDNEGDLSMSFADDRATYWLGKENVLRLARFLRDPAAPHGRDEDGVPLNFPPQF